MSAFHPLQTLTLRLLSARGRHQLFGERNRSADHGSGGLVGDGSRSVRVFPRQQAEKGWSGKVIRALPADVGVVLQFLHSLAQYVFNRCLRGCLRPLASRPERSHASFRLKSPDPPFLSRQLRISNSAPAHFLTLRRLPAPALLQHASGKRRVLDGGPGRPMSSPVSSSSLAQGGELEDTSKGKGG